MKKLDYTKLLARYEGRRVLVTGHTGFKGSWLCCVLAGAGAEVLGYSLEPPTSPSLFGLADIGRDVHSVIADVRDLDTLMRAFDEFQPEIVFHLAAQPIVRESYRDPLGTYAVNVMGAANVCECVRKYDSVRSFLNVTTDKVYLNREWEWGYREDEQLDGWDPYSNSKSCSELVTHSYARCFLSPAGVAMSTARAGNVIGGGDFASDRIVPDCVRALAAGESVVLRNPGSTRPYQHVLEPLFAYLLIADAQLADPDLAGWYNVGPDDADCVTTGELAGLFAEAWERHGVAIGMTPLLVEACPEEGAPHEAGFLKLDNSKIKHVFGWVPTWGIADALDATAEWTAAYLGGVGADELRSIMAKQVTQFAKR